MKPSNDYAQGQMMGMLCIIRLMRRAEESKQVVPDIVLTNIQHIATQSLSEYLQKPEEDIILLVDTELEKI